MPKLDIAPMASAFIEELTGHVETRVRFRLIHDKDRKREVFEFTDEVKHAWDYILARQAEGYGVFYFLNEVKVGTAGYATDKDVTRVRAIPADFDKGLPELYEWHTPPTLVVHTSPGKGQALWVETVPLAEFKPLCRRLIARYDSDPAVQNLSRVLRLPGSLHLKGEPTLVTYVRL